MVEILSNVNCEIYQFVKTISLKDLCVTKATPGFVVTEFANNKK